MDPAVHQERYSRGYRRCTVILKTLSSSRRNSPVQTILILLVESGLVFLAIQVISFGLVLLKVLTFLTDSILVDQCV